MEENQVGENIEDYRFSFKKLFLAFKDILVGEKNSENDKILEEVAKIKAQENTKRIQELSDNLENHQTIIKESRRSTTRSNINRRSEISINRTNEQGINKEIGE